VFKKFDDDVIIPVESNEIIPEKIEIKSVSILDGSTVQNFEIAHKKFPLLINECKHALIKCDENVIDSDNFDKLLELIKPVHTETKKEDKINTCKSNVSLLKEFTGDMNLIGKTEKFSFMILQFDKLQRKLDLLRFKHNQESDLEYLVEEIEILEEA